MQGNVPGAMQGYWTSLDFITNAMTVDISWQVDG
jgi:hypothetical protein